MPVITIRGHFGSYSVDIARELSDRLQTSYFDHELLRKVAKELQVSEEDVAELENVPITFRERFVQAVVRALEQGGGHPWVGVEPVSLAYPSHYMALRGPVGEDAYKKALERVVQDLASADSLVLTGKGTQIILNERQQAFHVFVTAPIEVRVKRVMERDGLSEGDAQKRIQEEDGRRSGFVKKYFGVDVTDMRLYDLVINTGKISKEAAIETILRLAEGEPSSSVSRVKRRTRRKK